MDIHLHYLTSSDWTVTGQLPESAIYSVGVTAVIFSEQQTLSGHTTPRRHRN
ncbi:hypothetical protein [Rhizobium sp. MHM7A]|uniref:hypothetical protein n=1 Tax=Rhizobium sp. MHM7A TaxID=2583233 RepID=UPI001485E18F|nr:hypothetical protein [Rhizobium sp. MHM7A]